MRAFYEERWATLPEPGEPWAWERRRRLLLDRVEPGARVLDLGCGLGAFTAAAAQTGARAVGVDVAEAALRRARAAHPGLDFRLAPPEGPLPLDDGEADLVWSSEVIEHVADTRRWLEEVRRVLRPGGRLLLTTPAHGRARRALIALARFESHFDPAGEHLRFYTRRSLNEQLTGTGFAPVVIREVGGPPLLRETLVADAVRATWRSHARDLAASGGS